MSPPGTALKPIVLLVDDEPHVLAALRRELRTDAFELLTAPNGAEALRYLAERPIDVLVSDLRMPGMDGNALLCAVRERWPGTMRMLLTGNAEMGDTIAAINRGEVHRYILKPWNADELRSIIAQALERVELVRERDVLFRQTQEQAEALRLANALLEQRVAQRTAELSQAHEALNAANERLRGSFFNSIRVFAALLELRNPHLAGHGRRVADVARRLSSALGLSPEECQDVFVAGLLHDIGEIGTPDAALRVPMSKLSGAAEHAFRAHAERGEQALMAIDELRGVASSIRGHHERYDGRGFPDGLAGDAIPIGARVLAVANDYDDLQSGVLVERRLSADEALLALERAQGRRYDPRVVAALREVQVQRPVRQVETPPGITCAVAGLRSGDVVARDILSVDGLLLLAAGHPLNERLIDLLRAYELRENVRLNIQVHREEAECPAA